MKLKTTKLFLTAAVIASAILSFTSCRNHDFKIKGEIYGAENQMMALEKPDFQGYWIAIDSIKINRNGGFTFSFPAPDSPEIYRLNLNDRYIYFPVDSTETLTIDSSFENFGKDFNLQGSANARDMAEFEKELQNRYSDNPDSLTSLKRSIYSKYMRNTPGSILSFYILTKTVDGKPLYNPADPQDRKYFGAVATGFKSTRPDDPHTALLEQTAITALRQKNSQLGKVREVEAQEIALIDLNLQDENGNYVKLSDIAGKGKKVAVIFSVLNVAESPQFNIALANLYNKKRDKVEFYNVSLDEDQYAWRDAAKNLPWITVYSPGGFNSEPAISYNVYELPAYFIYNEQGELVDRPMTMEQLDKAL